jgi:hypothetical protein
MCRLEDMSILALTDYWYNKKVLRINVNSVSDISHGGLQGYIHSRTGKKNYFAWTSVEDMCDRTVALKDTAKIMLIFFYKSYKNVNIILTH